MPGQKYVAAPIDGQRFEGLPCAKTGVCSTCKSPKQLLSDTDYKIQPCSKQNKSDSGE